MILAVEIHQGGYPSGFLYEMPVILSWVPLVFIVIFVVSFFKWLSGRKKDLPGNLRAVGLVCIIGLFVFGLRRGACWRNEPVLPGENVLPDMWLARCGVWVATVAFLLGWMPQIGWIDYSLMTGFDYDYPESAMFDAFGNLYLGSLVLMVGFAHYFILKFFLSGVAIQRASGEVESGEHHT